MQRFVRLFALGIAACVVAAAPSAAEDTYPSRPVRLVVGFGAGGPTDIPARFIADKLGNMLGQRVIVENKMGAAGMLATRDVLAQPADGYNLFLCTHFEAINTVLYKNPGFKLSDIAPVSLIAKYYYGVALSNSIPANTLEELMTYAKAHPGEVSYATLGAGSAQEIMARQFEKLAGISMNRIPFRSGSQIMPDLIAGRIDVIPADPPVLLPLVAANQIRPVVVLGVNRLASLPDTPTTVELGYSGMVMENWYGLLAPAGLPPDVAKKLEAAALIAIKSAAVQEHMKKGEISGTLNASEFAARIAKDAAYWRPMLPKLGITAVDGPAAAPSSAPAAPSR